MADYISREAVLNMAYWHSGRSDAGHPYPDGVYAVDVSDIEKIPAADVEPVRHGRWITPHWRNSIYCCNCSACGEEAMHRFYQWHNLGICPICPSCGAKMDLEDEKRQSNEQEAQRNE